MLPDLHFETLVLPLFVWASRMLSPLTCFIEEIFSPSTRQPRGKPQVVSGRNFPRVSVCFLLCCKPFLLTCSFLCVLFPSRVCSTILFALFCAFSCPCPCAASRMCALLSRTSGGHGPGSGVSWPPPLEAPLPGWVPREQVLSESEVQFPSFEWLGEEMYIFSYIIDIDVYPLHLHLVMPGATARIMTESGTSYDAVLYRPRGVSRQDFQSEARARLPAKEGMPMNGQRAGTWL